MTTTPRPWRVGGHIFYNEGPDAEYVESAVNEHDALVARVAAYESVLAEVRAGLALALENSDWWYVRDAINMIDREAGR